MWNKRHLLASAGLIATIALLPAVIDARTRKGDRFLKEGRAAEARQEWDNALGLYEQAVGEDPSDVGYTLAMRRARFQAGQKHVDAGQKLRQDGKLQEALMEFQKALIADPASAVALQEIKRIQDMVRTPPQSNVRPQDLYLTPAERERKASDERVSSMMEPPELKPMTLVVPTLKMNNQPPRVLYDTVAKLAGVNVVFDSQYNPPGRNFNVDLNNVTAEQAFDYLALLTHTFWKPINGNTIFVTDDNVTKRRDYEDDVVKVFYVTNATSVQEFQEIATAIRTVAEIRRVFTYNAQRAMIVRDTVDKVALAEKLIHDLDKPKSEVVVDVIVMEANSQRTRDLAATIATAGTAGINLPINFTPNGTPTTSGTSATPAATGNAITLNRLGSIATNQFSTTLPGGLLQALLTDSRTRVLNNPQVRASDGQKVSLKIGNRIPYATGSFQTNTAAALVSTQFNYADVGVNVDMTPQVHSADEVTLHVEVTVSSVQQYVSIGSISQPVIGQRANIADIRLREGEVNILGGLSQSQDSTTSNGIPGLVNIPVLGRVFFGNEHRDQIRGDLLIALIPHIVRTPDYTAENLRGIYAGTDQVVKINYAPKPGDLAPTPAPAKPAAAVKPASPRTTPIPVPAQPAAPVAPGSARVTFTPNPVIAQENGTLTISVQIDNIANLAEVSTLQLKYDPDQLRLNDILPGNLLSRDGVTAVNTVKDIRNDVGEASITLTRPTGAPGVSGTGPVAVLNFTAIGQGTSTVRVTELGLKSGAGQSIPAALGEVPVTIP
ncbi:MAG: cohesin domain-containing protein [Bryobacteraceae bacterium]